MDRAEQVALAGQLLERVEPDVRLPGTGGQIAGRWASGALAHLLLACAGNEDTTAEILPEVYEAAIELDREAGGGEYWRQAAYAAYELGIHFYFGGLAEDELAAKTALALRASEELLGRFAAGGPETPFQASPLPGT